MSNYTKTTDFEAKDSLPTGDSGKIIKGTEFETEFDNIATAITTKADIAAPTFTGVLTYATLNDGTTSLTSTIAELNTLDGITAVVGELNALDLGSTAIGTAVASKAVILDANKDYTGIRNLSLDGDLTVAGDDITMATNTAGNLLIADGTNFNSIAVGSLSEISTVASDDVLLAVDTSGGGLKKITRSTLVSGLATSSGISNIVEDTSPQLGGNLDMNGQDIVTTSNADLELAPDGTGHVTVKGNTNSGAIQFNCESNSHGQILKAQPHSAAVTNELLLPAGANSTLVSLVSTDTLTNKTLTSPKINEDVVVSATATEINLLDGVTATTSELNILDGVTATASELNILDGVTSTAGELNLLDGVTATTAELNYLDITTLGTTEASKAVTADANGVVKFDNGIQEESTALTSGTSVTLNIRDGSVYTITLAHNIGTFTWSNPAGSGYSSSFVLKVTQDGTGNRTISWPASVDWAGGTAPTLSTGANDVDVFVFFTVDGGTTYYGFTAGQDMS